MPISSSSPRKKILVVSHDASLTGAPVLLISLIRILQEQGYRFHALLVKGGPLESSFAGVADNCVVYYPKRNLRFGEKAWRKISGRNYRPDLRPLLKGVGYVISNTIINGEILSLLRQHYQGPVITYVHELEMVTHICTTPDALRQTLQHTTHFLADSHAISKFLQEKQGVPVSHISVINSYKPPLAEPLPGEADRFRSSAGIRASFVAGALAAAQGRKGPDLFVLVAYRVYQKIPDADIQFLWMGGKQTHLENRQLAYDIERLGLQDKVVLVNSSPEINVFFKNIQLFLLPSREDPYPLVVLDAASQQIPALCFSSSGGAAEFVSGDAGTVVPYLDIEAMADAVCTYYADRQLLRLHGLRAAERVARLHQDKKIVTDQLEAVLQQLSGSGI